MQKLVSIPRTPIGIVDTIKVRLDRCIESADILDLQDSGGWIEKGGFAHSLVRKIDGMRVHMREDMVLVEVSVPRLLGLASDEQHDVTESELVIAFEAMTEKLLPRTSAVAQKDSLQWYVVRIDLAINFDSDIDAVTEVVRKQNLRPTIQAGATTFASRGVAFFGSNHAPAIYRTDKRPGRGKLRTALDGRVFSNQNRNKLRFEFRFQTPKAIARLVEGMTPVEVGLPFKVAGPDGSDVIRTFLVDYHLLHRKLATVAARLTASHLDDVEGCGRGSVGVVIEILARFGEKQPELWTVLPRHLKERRCLQIKKAVGELEVVVKNVSLLSLCWNRARLSPELRRRLIEQLQGE